MDTIGQTNIAETLLNVLKELDLEKENLVVIISDGYENAPEGLVDQIVLAFKKKLDKKEKTMLLHLNPVFAPEGENVKKLSEIMQTYGIRDTKQLFIILLLSLIKNKKDKKIREIIEKQKQTVEIRERKKKNKGKKK